jgi:hypothetical protein
LDKGVTPIAAGDKCLDEPIIILVRASLKQRLEKRRGAGELNALDKSAFQVVGDESVFLCKEGEAVFEYGWHCVVAVNREEEELFPRGVRRHQV